MLLAYIEKLWEMTNYTIIHDDQEVGIQAFEFWSVVATEEADRVAENDEHYVSQNFMEAVLKDIVPVILSKIIEQVGMSELRVASLWSQCLDRMKKTMKRKNGVFPMRQEDVSS